VAESESESEESEEEPDFQDQLFADPEPTHDDINELERYASIYSACFWDYDCEPP